MIKKVGSFINKIRMSIYHRILIRKSKYLDIKYYSKTYNVKKSKVVSHYLKEGWKLGYDPSKKFSTSKYLEKNDKVKICPLLDYELYKHECNRNLVGTNIVYEGDFYSKKITRSIKRFISKALNIKLIHKNKDSKIMVILHLFYYYSFIEIKEYLKNLNSYNYDLIVTITKDCYDKNLEQDILKFKKDAKVIVCDNKGYDVGPFFHALNSINLKKYDIIIKAQSKGTNNGTRFVYGQIFRDRDWFLNLYEGVFGAFNIHKTIDLLKNNNKIGLVSAKNLFISDPEHKKSLIKKSLEEMKLDYYDNYKYVAGTCFAIKSNLLEDSKSLHIDLKDFDNTRRGEFSLAHVLERYICFEVAKKNKEFYGNDVCKFRRKRWNKTNNYLNSISAMNVINNDEYELSDDFVYHSIEGEYIKSYEVCNMKIKDIKRFWKGKYYNLKECSPYKYLIGDKESYEKYCKWHYDNNLPIMTLDRFDKLIKSIDKNGYIEKYIIVVNGRDNSVIDGQHRLCCLLKKYGEEKEIKVLKIYFRYFDLRLIKPFKNNIEEAEFFIE